MSAPSGSRQQGKSEAQKKWERKHFEVTRYRDQHNKDPEWFKHEKHVLICTWAGRPVFTRYGDDTALAAYMGVLSAIISNFQRLGDDVRTIKAGRHVFVFLIQGPLYLIAISKSGESVAMLRRHLEYVHSQIISVLTIGVHQMIEQHAGYDVRELLGGCQPLLMDLITECDSNPCYLLDSVSCLRLPKPERSRITTVLRKCRTKSLFCALLLAGSSLVSLVRGKDRTIHPSDLLILVNTVNNAILSQTESWTPVCLPLFNTAGYCYAYIAILAPDVTLVLITLAPDDLPVLKNAKDSISVGLQQRGSLEGIQQAMHQGLFRVEEVGAGTEALIHFLYKSESTNQSLCPAFEPPFHTARGRKALFRMYQHTYGRVFSRGVKRHVVYYQVTSKATILAWIRQDEFELYAVFSPLVTKVAAINACNRILRWVKREETSLFIL